MMDLGYRFILYLLIIALLGGGIALFLFRQPLAESLNRRAEESVSLMMPASGPAPVRAEIDTEVLRSPRLDQLVDNSPNFDFSNVCWRPAGSRPAVATPANQSATNTPVLAGPRTCAPGNGLPFIVKEKE